MRGTRKRVWGCGWAPGSIWKHRGRHRARETPGGGGHPGGPPPPGCVLFGGSCRLWEPGALKDWLGIVCGVGGQPASRAPGSRPFSKGACDPEYLESHPRVLVFFFKLTLGTGISLGVRHVPLAGSAELPEPSSPPKSRCAQLGQSCLSAENWGEQGFLGELHGGSLAQGSSPVPRPDLAPSMSTGGRKGSWFERVTQDVGWVGSGPPTVPGEPCPPFSC